MTNRNLDTENTDQDPDLKEIKIGGWLRFYKIITIISLSIAALLIVVIAALAVLGIDAGENIYDLAATALEIAPSLAFSILVLKIIEVRENDTPSKINHYILAYTIATFVIYAGLRYLFANDFMIEKPTPALGTVIYYFIWTSYFKKSKRVKEFYGSNADQKIK